MIGIRSYCRITGDRVVLNGEPVGIAPSEKGGRLGAIYHSLNLGYPKFFKMDRLSKAGFLGASLVLEDCGFDHETPKEDVSVIFANRSSSLDNDTAYVGTIQPDDFFPSPAVFVYTLANIVTGEVAIRYRIKGETSFFIAERFSPQMMRRVVEGAFCDSPINRVVCGWTEYMEERCDVLVMLAERLPDSAATHDVKEFNEENINILYLK